MPSRWPYSCAAITFSSPAVGALVDVVVAGVDRVARSSRPPPSCGWMITIRCRSFSSSPKTATASNVTGSRFGVFSPRRLTSSPVSVSLPFQGLTCSLTMVLHHSRRSSGSLAGISVGSSSRSPSSGASAGCRRLGDRVAGLVEELDADGDGDAGVAVAGHVVGDIAAVLLRLGLAAGALLVVERLVRWGLLDLNALEGPLAICSTTAATARLPASRCMSSATAAPLAGDGTAERALAGCPCGRWAGSRDVATIQRLLPHIATQPPDRRPGKASPVGTTHLVPECARSGSGRGSGAPGVRSGRLDETQDVVQPQSGPLSVDRVAAVDHGDVFGGQPSHQGGAGRFSQRRTLGCR